MPLQPNRPSRWALQAGCVGVIAIAATHSHAVTLAPATYRTTVEIKLDTPTGATTVANAFNLIGLDAFTRTASQADAGRGPRAAPRGWPS